MINFLNKLLKSIFGSKFERDIKKIQPIVNIINLCEILFINKTNEQLQDYTEKYIYYNNKPDNFPDNYIEDLFKEIKHQIEYIKNNDIEKITQNFKDILFKNRKQLEEKFDENKFGTVILNSLSDKRINKLTDDYQNRISSYKDYTEEKLNELKIEYDQWWTNYLASLDDEPKILDKILPEAFALVRESSSRVLGLRHFDVQLIGGIVLHQGKIAEMKTGEGKTLAATLAVYLNSLTEKGVHIITVNDYLAKRDSIWMGELYIFLKRTVGLIYNNMSQRIRKEAYNCDITFGTNNEFGFDYLRDNMAVSLDNVVQRSHNYAIIDEVDSILIDEARTPLIISGASEDSTEKYYKINRLFSSFKKGERIEEMEEVTETGDYFVDEKTSNATLTEKGVAKAERVLNISNLYSPENMDIVHNIIQMLRAHNLFKRDTDYIVKDGQVIIVDEFTGRLMPGRRWSDGLHQAVEAKEGVKIENESQTLATITLQNYFRMYNKLSGMTGTADTEAKEFMEIYKLEVVVIPTNLPMVRNDHDDAIYRTTKEKFNAVIDLIVELNKDQRPVLVGTISIETSELLSTMLKKKNVAHRVLNAKFHEREADIIALAGQKGAVTIATNMAGRGTDIMLGDEVPELGGLFVLGTERHESRRIDNQLRGRSGRQGDKGDSRFYVSLEDNLMRLFGSDRVSSIMLKLGMEEGQEISHPFISKSIEHAQKKVEDHNFEIRKHLLKFDNVMNEQRDIIYKERNKVLYGDNVREFISDIIKDKLDELVEVYCPKKIHWEDWNTDDLSASLFTLFNLDFNKKQLLEYKDADKLYHFLKDYILKHYNIKINELGEDRFSNFEKFVMLHVIDDNWKDHLYNLDHLKEGIGLRGFAGKNPEDEFSRECLVMFEQMNENIKESIIEYLFKIKGYENEQAEAAAVYYEEQHSSLDSFSAKNKNGDANKKNTGKSNNTRKVVNKKNVTGVTINKIGRNEPCPCGSGKKYKKCCGR